MEKKGISMAVAIIVAVVTMLVIAFSVVSFVERSVDDFSGNSMVTVDTSAFSIRCQAELVTRCSSNASGCICAACKSCPPGTVCP